MMELKIRKIGNASGVILSREILNRFHVKDGDKLYLTEAPDGSYRITPYDPEFEKQISLGKNAMSRFRNTLRELAK
jgi:putative addiction module antidote